MSKNKLRYRNKYVGTAHLFPKHQALFLAILFLPGKRPCLCSRRRYQREYLSSLQITGICNPSELAIPIFCAIRKTASFPEHCTHSSYQTDWVLGSAVAEVAAVVARVCVRGVRNSEATTMTTENEFQSVALQHEYRYLSNNWDHHSYRFASR